MINCLIIGFGNIGRRHLESLSKSKKKISFYILEKNLFFLKKFKKKKIINYDKHNFYFYEDLTVINQKEFDLAIFATNSDNRYKLFKFVSSKKKIKNIIFEKVVFQSIYQFNKALKILNKKKINAWVNCPRRNIYFFKNLKKKIKYSKNFTMTFEGNNWHMCSNTIHFLDLFFFYIGINKNIKFKTELKNQLIKSKRSGFYETNGKIEVFTKNSCKKLILLDSELNKKNSRLIIEHDNHKIIIIMNNKKNNVSFYLKNKLTRVAKFHMPFQSQMTLGIFEDILKKNRCELAKIKESFYHHKLLYSIFANFFKKNLSKKKIINFPIT